MATMNGLPEFLIVGAEKSGTTSLYYYLSQHPKIHMARIKEPYFFSACRRPAGNWVCKANEKRGIESLSDYLDLFREATPGQIKGEASTLYLYDWINTIPEIKKAYGKLEPKIIIILRDPVDRAWSSYQMKVRDGEEDADFLTAIDRGTIDKRLADGYPDYFDYVGFGRYLRQVTAYQSQFQEVFVLLQEDLRGDNAQRTLDSIWNFLGIEKAFVNTTEEFNKSGKPRNRLAGLMSSLLYRPNILKSTVNVFVPKVARYRFRVWAGQHLFIREAPPARAMKALKEIYDCDKQALGAAIGRDLASWA